MPPTPSWLWGTWSVIFGMNPPTSVPVVSGMYLPTVPREGREACRNAGDVKPVGRLLDEQLVATRAWGRQEHAVRLVRQALVAAEEPDQPIDLVVIGCDVVVGDGPIVAQAV